jgi:hypothetical protein
VERYKTLLTNAENVNYRVFHSSSFSIHDGSSPANPKATKTRYMRVVCKNPLKGIVQPFELKCVTRLIRSAVKNWRSGNFFKSLLMTQSRERSIKPFTAA